MNRKYIYKISLAVLLFFSFLTAIMAGEPSPSTLRLKYTRLSDGTRRFEMSLISFGTGNEKTNIENARLQVSLVKEDGTSLLGECATDWKGKAFFDIAPGRPLVKNPDGTYSFTVSYDGNAAYAKASENLKVKDVNLDVILDEKDTTKNVTAAAYELNDNGTKVYIPGLDIEFSVVRIFGLYPFATAKTDSSGKCSATFPKKFPGDRTGNVIVVARILDHETYANVEKRQSVNWGIPVIPEPKPSRGLGDTDAPLWMVYTLLVLLSGVWLHFLYIIYLVIKINYLGKKKLKAGFAN